jgi:Fur family transcriptional regulator, peroxide stress response regulator
MGRLAEKDRRGREEELEHRCKELGVPLTIQRREVLKSVIGRSDHPTPDDVYEDVATRVRGISRGTVYRTLDTLARLKLIVRVGHPGSSTRYDGHTERHHHLVCEECGAIRDLEDTALDALAMPELGGTGFRVRDYSVYYRGLCSRCAAQSASSKKSKPKSQAIRRRSS